MSHKLSHDLWAALRDSTPATMTFTAISATSIPNGPLGHGRSIYPNGFSRACLRPGIPGQRQRLRALWHQQHQRRRNDQRSHPACPCSRQRRRPAIPEGLKHYPHLALDAALRLRLPVRLTTIRPASRARRLQHVQHQHARFQCVLLPHRNAAGGRPPNTSTA